MTTTSISLNEARKILGKETSDKLSDEELQQLIWNLEALARETIKAIKSGEMKFPDDTPYEELPM